MKESEAHREAAITANAGLMVKVTVAPAPVEPPDFDGVVVTAPTASPPLVRRQSTWDRYAGLPEFKKNECRTFRSLGQLHTLYSLLATIVVCALLVLLVGVPYAANERMADASPVLQPAMRGLIVGIWLYFLIGPGFLVNAPTLVRGGFHPRFLLSLPLTLGSAVGVAFIPVDGSTLGIVSIALLAVGISFVLCSLLLNAPFYATDEHKALDQSLGPPTFAVCLLFFGVITAYVVLTQLYSSPLVGLLLPTASAMMRMLTIVALTRSFHMSSPSKAS